MQSHTLLAAASSNADFQSPRSTRLTAGRTQSILLDLSSTLANTHHEQDVLQTATDVLHRDLRASDIDLYGYADNDEFVRRIASPLGTRPGRVGRERLLGSWSWVGVSRIQPIKARGVVRGFWVLQPKDPAATYDTGEIAFLSLLANLTALALDRFELARETGDGLMHELKTPLANILMPAGLALQELQLLEQGVSSLEESLPRLRRQLTHISKHSQNAGKRLDALQYLENSPSLSIKQDIPPQALIDDVLSSFCDVPEFQHIHLEFRATPGLPPICGNAAQLEIALRNLIQNALDALHGSQTQYLGVSIDQGQGNQIEIQITDSGRGIPVTHREKVFDAHFSTKSPHGRGMGLHLAREIIHAHEGRISLHESNWGGCCFRIELPASTELTANCHSKPFQECNSVK